MGNKAAAVRRRCRRCSITRCQAFTEKTFSNFPFPDLQRPYSEVGLRIQSRARVMVIAGPHHASAGAKRCRAAADGGICGAHGATVWYKRRNCQFALCSATLDPTPPQLQPSATACTRKAQRSSSRHASPTTMPHDPCQAVRFGGFTSYKVVLDVHPVDAALLQAFLKFQELCKSG